MKQADGGTAYSATLSFSTLRCTFTGRLDLFFISEKKNSSTIYFFSRVVFRPVYVHPVLKGGFREGACHLSTSHKVKITLTSFSFRPSFSLSGWDRINESGGHQ